MTPVSHGKPCAGNPHARFEEGASAPENPRRNALLLTMSMRISAHMTLAMLLFSSVSCDMPCRLRVQNDSQGSIYVVRPLDETPYDGVVIAESMEEVSPGKISSSLFGWAIERLLIVDASSHRINVFRHACSMPPADMHHVYAGCDEWNTVWLFTFADSLLFVTEQEHPLASRGRRIYDHQPKGFPLQPDRMYVAKKSFSVSNMSRHMVSVVHPALVGNNVELCIVDLKPRQCSSVLKSVYFPWIQDLNYSQRPHEAIVIDWNSRKLVRVALPSEMSLESVPISISYRSPCEVSFGCRQ